MRSLLGATYQRGRGGRFNGDRTRAIRDRLSDGPTTLRSADGAGAYSDHSVEVAVLRSSSMNWG